MEVFDLGIAWNREWDNEFIQGLNDLALKEGLKPYLLHAYNFYSALKDIATDRISFRLFLDRSSDDDPAFRGLADFLRRKRGAFINFPDHERNPADRPRLHNKFRWLGIPVAKQDLLKVHGDEKTEDLRIKFVSSPFALKRGFLASGKGVMLEARSKDGSFSLSEQKGMTPYLTVREGFPVEIENKPGWFRAFYCFGKTYPCWWHPENHVYAALATEQIAAFGLHDIWRITQRIREISQLDFFSTDIAMRNDRKLVVAEHVNDHPSMNKKSKCAGGVPDEIVGKITKDIILSVKAKVR